jgi:hypothetical protein
MMRLLFRSFLIWTGFYISYSASFANVVKPKIASTRPTIPIGRQKRDFGFLSGAGSRNGILPSKSKSDMVDQVKSSVALGTSLGASLGTSIPIMSDVLQIPKDVDIMKSRIKHSIDNENYAISNPSDVLHQMQPNGEEWSYSKMLNSISDNNIIGISIHQDGKYAYVIEKNIHHTVCPESIHQVVTIPIHIAELIDTFVQYHINFDIFI